MIINRKYSIYKLLYLYLTFFFIYSCFLYIQSSPSKLKSKFCHYDNFNIHEFLIGIECFTVLLGGILAAFVVPAYIMMIISLICLFIGIAIFEIVYYVLPDNEYCKISKSLIIFAICTFGIFYGLFRFLFLVIILDQKDNHNNDSETDIVNENDCEKKTNIQRKIAGWFFVLNFSYLFVYVLFPTYSPENLWLTICIPLSIIGIILFIFGLNKYYVINSSRTDFIRIIHSLRKPVTQFSTVDPESKEALVSISNSVIIFLLLIPFGICDSQNRYAYNYQSNQMRLPVSKIYFLQRPNFWPSFFSSITVIIVLLLVFGLKYFMICPLKSLYSNLKLRIFIGNILIILSTLASGLVETYRLKIYWNYNSTTMTPSPRSFKQTIGNETYEAADMSVFFMVPQIVLLAFSEILVYLSCMEFMYIKSVNGIKYLSMALLLGAIGSGGLSDFFFITINSLRIYNETDLNKRVAKNGTDICCSKESRLDYVLYGLSGLAILSLILSFIFMKLFPHRFSLENSNLHIESQNSAEPI